MCTVLFVTDDLLTRKRVTSMLDGMELQTMVAGTEFEVTRACVASAPAIVISDIEMAGGVGFESIAVARQHLKDAYIIAMSRSTHDEMWTKVAAACGADEYVPWPLSPGRLVEAIERSNEATKTMRCLPSD